jgi:NAD(P)-dependent dehydrogenase (short-subunit alcohol dehydrogenase family)
MTVTDTQLSGKVAVITGGTQGPGEATARLFAGRGAAGLVLCGRNVARGEVVARELNEAGCRTIFVQADLARLDDCRQDTAEADGVFDRVDVLVNAAGITDRGTLLDTSPELFDRIRVNGLNSGWMDTPGEDRTQRQSDGAPADWLERAEREQPFGRLLKPEEVARAIAFLASDEPGMMTGAVIDFGQSVAGCYDSPPHPPKGGRA